MEDIAEYLEQMAEHWAEGEYIRHYLLGEAAHIRFVIAMQKETRTQTQASEKVATVVRAEEDAEEIERIYRGGDY